MSLIHGVDYNDVLRSVRATPQGLLMVSYDTVVSSAVHNLDTIAGGISLPSEVVPVDEEWVIEAFSIANDNRGGIRVAAYISPNQVDLVDTVMAATARSVCWAGRLTLKAGERMIAIINATVLHDVCHFRYHYGIHYIT
jgi:hypothetical protein